MKEILTDFRFWTFIIALLSLLWSACNFIVGKYVHSKLMGNDLKHLTADVDNLKVENKEYKKELKNELNKIFRRLGNIERNQVKRDAICDERHGKKRQKRKR